MNLKCVRYKQILSQVYLAFTLKMFTLNIHICKIVNITIVTPINCCWLQGIFHSSKSEHFWQRNINLLLTLYKLGYVLTVQFLWCTSWVDANFLVINYNNLSNILLVILISNSEFLLENQENREKNLPLHKKKLFFFTEFCIYMYFHRKW